MIQQYRGLYKTWPIYERMLPMIADIDFLLKTIGTKMERLVGFCSELKMKMRASSTNRLLRSLESLTVQSSLFLHWGKENSFN